MNLEQTVRDLKSLGLDCTVVESGAEGAFGVVPECGRVLGLWPHWRGENALWVDPDFLDALRAGARDDSWLCPGGDAMRLAPAAEFLEDGRTPPPSLDPGRYCRRAEKGVFAMQTSGDAWAWKAGLRVGFRLERRFHPLSEQDLEERWGAAWLRRAGYEEEAVLELPGNRPPSVGLWNILRVRPGGEARIPLRRYWGDTRLAALPSGTVGLADVCAVFPLAGDAAVRLGLEAAEVRPRIMYIEEHEPGRAMLLVRDFQAASPPSAGSFVECARPAGRGPGELACFSPVLAGDEPDRRGGGRISWKLAVGAFSGRTAEVRALVHRLAGQA